MHGPPHTLTRAADVLLDPAASPGDQLAAAHALRDVLAELAGWSETGPGTSVETPVAGGVAISPLDASRCIPEFRRTAAFLQGTLQAIGRMERLIDGPVEVLYAGCGPLAPLAVALCHRAPRARFWPVDIHEANAASVRRLVEAAGVADRFGDIAAADASRHRWPVTGHVGVAEVLQRGLEKEPQVAVTAHLAAQLAAEGILVPRSIALDVQLFDPAREFDPESPAPVRVPLARLLELTRESAEGLRAGALVDVDYAEPAGLQVMVSTRIEVADDVVLADRDCSLTLPWVAHDLGLSGPGRRGRVRHLAGGRPQLEAERLEVAAHAPPTDDPVDLAALSLDAARALVGQTFVRPNPDGPTVLLRLLSAEPAPRDPRAEPRGDRPFGLVFQGPHDPRLTQGMHPLQHPTHPFHGLFLVPVGESGDGRLYQAVFS